MSFSIAGVSHSSCPIEVRERLAALDQGRAARAFEAHGFPEVLILSTCNRFEVYAAEYDDGDLPPLERLIATLRELSGTEIDRHIYSSSGEEAVRHLLRVASGLDSLVLGETEIMGQIKQAYKAARDGGRTRKRMNVLFQRALFAGKAVRNRTNISMGQVSVASVAVELAKRIFGRLSEKTVLVLGAGEMAEKTAKHLQSAKASRLCFANRTWKKAAALAERLRAEAVAWESFEKKMVDADIVVASTGATDPIVTVEQVQAALTKRGGRPLFFIDIAMPRDVAPGVHDLDGVYLYDLEDFKGIVSENLSRRSGEVASADEIIKKESERLGLWLAALDEGRATTFRHSDLAGSSHPRVLRSVHVEGQS